MSSHIVHHGQCSEDKPPDLKPGVIYINHNKEDQAEVYGYKSSAWKKLLTGISILLTGGLLGLVFHWFPERFLKATHDQCPLVDSTKILLVEHYEKLRRTFVKDVKILKAENVSLEKYYSILQDRVPSGEKLSDQMKTTKIDGNRHSIEASRAKGDNMLPIPKISGEIKYAKEIRWFSWKKLRYLWDENSQSYYCLSGLDVGQTPEDIHSFRGLSQRQQFERRLVYGENVILVPVRPIWTLLFLEVLHPFYIFQVFSVLLWYIDHYEAYATVILVTSVLSIITQVYQMHRNEMSLSSTVQARDVVKVVRDSGETELISSEHLSPGDVIVIPRQGCVMQCDAVLMRGNAIVSESMLTGESVPITKVPLISNAGTLFSEKEHARHILFCGTRVIQTRYYENETVTAVVIRTGFLTSKGRLVKSILYPLPVDFKFTQDAYKFIMFLVGVASIGLVYTAITKALRGVSASALILDSLDLITIVVPPALPMAMTIGILYALRRLKQHKIFCISPRSINLSGILDCICFDKTGTLTEDGMDMKGVVEATNHEMGSLKSPPQVPNDTFLHGMATCHSATLIEGELVGDPLDLKMFASTGWSLEEPAMNDGSKYDVMMPTIVKPQNSESKLNEAESEQIGILRQFPFSSSLQRMSVITRKLGDSHFNLFCKGAPEMIASLSTSGSLPEDFSSELLTHTSNGYRVLGLAWKPLQELSYVKAQRISREDVEVEMTFLGLLVFENRIKPETTKVIEELQGASIRTIIVTGDNILTAVSVGRECGIIGKDTPVVTVEATSKINGQPPHISYKSTSKLGLDNMAELEVGMPGSYCFAIEGGSWSVLCKHFPNLLPSIVVRGAIFARMSPDQKQQLVMELQKLQYYVGMCGDGANDCGALKSAHVGISLSEAEASVASPFTSKKSNISCVSALIREGRAALVTSFGIFKYMATYSLTQFVSIMILYSLDSSLSDYQFLYIDLFLITIFVLFFGMTNSFKGPFAAQPPPHSLISLAPILSILLHISHIIVFQVISFVYVQEQPWFVSYNASTLPDRYYGSHENYAVFCISQFQYIIIAVVFSKGAPYRKPFYTNYLLLACTLVMSAFSVYLTVCPSEWLLKTLEISLPPSGASGADFFRWLIVILAFTNSVLAIFVETFVIEYLFQTRLKSSKSCSGYKSRKKHLDVERQLQINKNWPIYTDPLKGKER